MVVMNLRRHVLRALLYRFGEPRIESDPAGVRCHWRLARSTDLDMHVMIGSPKMSTVQVLVSDPCQTPPIRFIELSDVRDITRMVDDVQAQWQMHGCWSIELERVLAHQ